MRIYSILSIVLSLSSLVSCYCRSPGANPSFSGDPVVTQLNMSRVSVSWRGLIRRLDCADNVAVKYWLWREPGNYEMTDFRPTDVDSVELDVLPRVRYMFQVIAREDKGWLLGVDYNKSPIVKFTTSSKPRKPRISSRADKRSSKTQTSEDDEDVDMPSAESSLKYLTIGAFALGGAVIVVVLIAVGLGICKWMQRKSPNQF